jgi:hypothetical protein
VLRRQHSHAIFVGHAHLFFFHSLASAAARSPTPPSSACCSLCSRWRSVVGLIYPPPEVRNIVDKTAAFVAKNGLEFAGKIATEKAGQAKFRFLQPDSACGPIHSPLTSPSLASSPPRPSCRARVATLHHLTLHKDTPFLRLVLPTCRTALVCLLCVAWVVRQRKVKLAHHKQHFPHPPLLEFASLTCDERTRAPYCHACLALLRHSQ